MTSGRIQHDGSTSIVHRRMSDILTGYSTLPGFSSNRDIYLGTWYIQAICEIFMEHACDTDIEDMLKMVSSSSLFYGFTELTQAPFPLVRKFINILKVKQFGDVKTIKRGVSEQLLAVTNN